MTRTIATLIDPGGRSLDVSGPMEVSALASRQVLEEDPGREPPNRLLFVTPEHGPVRMASGMALQADLACGELRGSVAAVLVSGGMGDALDRACANAELVAWGAGHIPYGYLDV